MPQANILTDAKLKQLYYEIADDYAFLSGIQTPFPLTAAQIAEELNRRLYNSLTNPSCPLYSLPDVEKDKAFTVLNTYLRATLVMLLLDFTFKIICNCYLLILLKSL